ncbi:hypothetical protein ACHAW6_002446 [Cyclotella cf. meneghiniana]
MKKFHNTASKRPFLLFLLIPTAIQAFVPTSVRSIQYIRDARPNKATFTVLYQHQQQPYYNESDGQYYYYNESDGQYYTEDGQMWTSHEGKYQQQQQQQQQLPYQLVDYNQGQSDPYQQTNEYINKSNEQQPSLITANFAQEMSQLNFEGGIDYLSLAKQRALEKRESRNSGSTDADWMALAREKLDAGDGWEASLNDAGSEGDAAALGIGTFVTEGGIVVETGGDGDEPTLLL